LSSFLAVGVRVVIRTPFSTWGRHKKMIDFNIDYLQFSSNVSIIAALQSEDSHNKTSNMRFYKRMTVYENGVRKYVGNTNTGKALIVLDGKTCAKLGVDKNVLTDVLGAWQGTVSRIDLAMTIDKEIIEQFMADKEFHVSTLWQTTKAIVDENKKVQTVYVGDMKNRGRKGIVRCYDKAAELGLEDCILNRVEIELKHKHAQISSQRIARGASIQSVMNSKFKIAKKWYSDIFSEDVATERFPHVEQFETTEIQKKMAWLMQQVVPSLRFVKEHDQKNGTKNWQLLMKEVEKYGHTN